MRRKAAILSCCHSVQTYAPAGASEDKANAAAKELAGYEREFAGIRAEFAAVRGDLKVLRWMQGATFAGIVTVLFCIFTH